MPLAGPVGAVLSWFGVGRSSRNPNCCTRCNTHIEEGRLVEITMMFADLSSFTELTNRLGAEETFGVVDKYLREAGAILSSHGAYIDKYIGDAVMAFFNAPVRRKDHAAAAVAAAQDLQRRLPELSKELGLELKASVGIATGFARVGRLGSDDIKDYSAIGPVVNQAARLQAQAKSGEILVSREVYAAVADAYPGVPPETLVLKGFKEPSVAHRLGGHAGPGPATAAPLPLDGPALSWVGLLLSFAGAGCLGKVLVGSAALSAGAGSGSFLLALAIWLDGSWLRFPLLLGAGGAALASLVLVVRESRERRAFETKNGCIVVTQREKLRNLAIVAVSFFALLFVLFELLMHYHNHQRILR